MLKLLVPFAAFGPLMGMGRGLFVSNEKGLGEGTGYLDVTARTLKIDTWIDLGEVEGASALAWSWEAVALLVWGVGFAVLGVVWARQYFQMRRMLNAKSEEAGEVWQELAVDVWKKGIRAMPEILVCREEGALAGVFGVFRPEVVIPASLEGELSQGEREAFLRHEFQHVYKRDTLWLFVQTLIRNLFWMHPLVWWLDRQISAEREILRDEEVIRKTENVTSYLNCLMKVSKIKLPGSYATSVGIMGAPFVKRIKSLSRFGKSRAGDVASAVGSVLAVVALTAFLSASLSLSDLKAETANEAKAKVMQGTEPDLTEAEQSLVKEMLSFYEGEGGRDRALKMMLGAIDADSTAAFEFIVGNFYAEKGELEQAIDYYGRAAEKFPRFLRAIRNRGILQAKASDYEGAKESLLWAKRVGANDSTTDGLLGLSYLNTGDAASAEHYYRLAIEASPEVNDWQIGLAKILYDQARKDEGDAVILSAAERMVASGKEDEAEVLLKHSGLLEAKAPEIKTGIGSR